MKKRINEELEGHKKAHTLFRILKRYIGKLYAIGSNAFEITGIFADHSAPGINIAFRVKLLPKQVADGLPDGRGLVAGVKKTANLYKVGFLSAQGIKMMETAEALRRDIINEFRGTTFQEDYEYFIIEDVDVVYDQKQIILTHLQVQKAYADVDAVSFSVLRSQLSGRFKFPRIVFVY